MVSNCWSFYNILVFAGGCYPVTIFPPEFALNRIHQGFFWPLPESSLSQLSPRRGYLRWKHIFMKKKIRMKRKIKCFEPQDEDSDENYQTFLLCEIKADDFRHFHSWSLQTDFFYLWSFNFLKQSFPSSLTDAFMELSFYKKNSRFSKNRGRFSYYSYSVTHTSDQDVSRSLACFIRCPIRHHVSW